MLELTYVSIGLLVIKEFSDISKFRWTRSILSEVPFFDWWKNFRSPFDLWHMLQGLLYTWIAYHLLSDAGYNGLKLYLYTGIWWAVFFFVHNAMYHYFLMKPEWRDWSVFK